MGVRGFRDGVVSRGPGSGVVAALLVGVAVAGGAAAASAQEPAPPYRDTSLSFEARAADLVGRMTLEEKVSQMVDVAAAIPRLGIPAYNWWNEALHGVARAGLATSFPQAIGMAATWDDSLIFREARVIADEARAKYHEFLRHGTPRAVRGADLLVAQRQPVPGPALGPRPGDVRRGPVPRRPAGDPVRARPPGRRPEVPEDGLHAQALRGAQRPRAAAPPVQRAAVRARPARELPAAVPGRDRDGGRGIGDVRLQPGGQLPGLRQRPAAQGHPARPVGVPRLRRLRLRRGGRHLPDPQGGPDGGARRRPWR